MKYLLALILLIAAVPLHAAAPVYDAGGSATAAGASTVGVTITVAGPNSLMIADAGYYTAGSAISINDITSAAGAFTSVAGEDVDSINYRLEMWRRVGASGSQTATATAAGPDFNPIVFSLRSYSNVDQVAPLGTPVTDSGGAGTSTNPSVTVSSATGKLVIDSVLMRGGNALSAGASQTERVHVDDGGIAGFDLAGSDEAGAASVVMDWTTDDAFFAIIGASVNPVAAAAARRSRVMVIP